LKKSTQRAQSEDAEIAAKQGLTLRPLASSLCELCVNFFTPAPDPCFGAVMNFKTLVTTFGLIFLAEMGDKTQLAAITMVAKTREPLAVFVGASLALVAVSLIGVAVGAVLVNYINPDYLRRAAAVAFIVIGVLMLWDKI
jgi:putative Ca2+/H+ antiporter (TMEM165/GDT1 family)